MNFKLINKSSGKDTVFTNEKIAEFLYNHLDQYGDEKKHILKCLEYVFQPDRDGHIMLLLNDDQIIGAVVINETGMGGYIPENILVYIALHKDHRGKGHGKELMQRVIKVCNGDIALHVEPENPAFHLYKKLGFDNKYLEMRLKR